MNATRIIDLIVCGLIALSLIAGVIWFVHEGHPWWALAFFSALLFLRPDYRPDDCKCDEDKEKEP